MKVYTRSGDKGSCRIVGGHRVSKDDVRIECLGTVDEANSTIGVIRAHLEINHPWQEKLKKIQTDMMNLMSHIATKNEDRENNQMPLPEDGAEFCEKWIDEMESEMEQSSDYFLLPGGTPVSAWCHMARTQIRRAERCMVTLNSIDPVPECIYKYINRLSDLFFMLARHEMEHAEMEEEKWRLFRLPRKKKKT